MPSLTVVGTGLVPDLHRTRESADIPGPRWREGQEELALAALEEGVPACVAYSGHPATFRRAAHELMAAASLRGFPARMLPAIWLEDCLCADLELDPLEGWQAFEAANFLLHQRKWSPDRALVLWRLDHIWERDAIHVPWRTRCLKLLAEHLAAAYGREHRVVLYTPGKPTWTIWLRELHNASPAEVLYVPPRGGDWFRPPAGRQLTVIGTGMEPGHRTELLTRALADSDDVFFLDPAVQEWLLDGQALTQENLHQSLAAGRTAALLVPGHAAMGGIGRALVKMARELGFTARLLPSVSPLGAMYAQIGLNPTDGCQVARGEHFPPDGDPTAPAFLVSPEGWVKPIFPQQVGGADPVMLERMTAAAAHENTEALLACLEPKEREAFETVVFDRLRALADEQGVPSIKKLKPKAVEVISLRAIQELSMDRIVEMCYSLGLDPTSPGALMAYSAEHPESGLARLAWLNAFSRKAWEAL